MQHLSGAILAGGRASRFGGRAKALLPIGGARIIDRQLAALRGTVDETFVVADDPAPFAAIGLRVVPDRVSGAGALGGLMTALAASPAPATIVLACDLPFVTAAFLRFLAAECHGDVALPKTADGYHPLCACWSREALPEIERRVATGGLRIIDALSALRVREIGPGEVARFDRPAGTLLFNVNTPHEYERALQLTKSYHDRFDVP
ncbi:MAG TPA: molybdenum cofactor guanylyltransferase [Vicinamibacterales bacterium]|nr:molybdenum cofactor guanylyltransferase [Vicinamibacterales bacterium]